MNNNDLFERLYNELEDLLRVKFKLPSNASAIYFYESKVTGDQAKNFRMLRELRNYIVHDKRIDTIDAFRITDEAVAFLKNAIARIERPVRAIDVCVLKNQVLFAQKNTPVISLMKSMLERNISHVPVLDELGILYGVYSGATLFLYLTDKVKTTIDHKTLIEDFNDYLPINQHIGERYWFINRTLPIEEIIALFGKTSDDGKKLKMLFVTENGKPSDKILGLITPWNILDNDVVAA